MIKSILVAIDGSEHAQAATEYAFWLAERLDGEVLGLHIVDIVAIEGSFVHDVSGSLGFEPYLDFSTKMREVLTERGKGLLEAFAEEARRRNVRADTALAMGIVANEITERARTADLVVIGHRGVNEKFSAGMLGGTAESVSRKCPKPVLISPARFRPCSKPLLAYDGSARAASAMQVAVDFCATLGLPLDVLTVNKEAERGQTTLAEAQGYLVAHGIAGRLELEQSGKAPEGIASFLRQHGHDLLFIGAYGHSRVIEMVIGSTTEYVLRNAPCPVFLNR
jgi:nucleotide-binding universal stress UspA family protein